MSKDNWGHSSGARKIMASTLNEKRIPNLRRGCFASGGPHVAFECPRRKSTKVMAPQDKARNLDEGLDNKYEPLDILDEVDDRVIEVMVGATKVKPLCFTVGVPHIDHLYLVAKINGHACNTMIDSGATHNFITLECVTEFGLKTMSLKDVSIRLSKAQPMLGP